MKSTDAPTVFIIDDGFPKSPNSATARTPVKCAALALRQPLAQIAASARCRGVFPGGSRYHQELKRLIEQAQRRTARAAGGS